MKTYVRYAPRTRHASMDSLLSTMSTRATCKPAVDIREAEDGYVLEAEFAGIAEQDVDIQIEDNLLTITAETNREESEKEKYLVRERNVAPMKRSFVIPKDVDRDAIEASFANGVLTVALKKAESAKPRTIEIKSN